MIYELVYADANIVAATQGFCTCGDKSVEHKMYRTESPVLIKGVPGAIKGSRGTRRRRDHFLTPAVVSYDTEYELEVGTQVMSPINSLLFVNKQTYLEALPHLYRNTVFFFDDWEDTKKFVKTVGRDCLKLIRAIEVFQDYSWQRPESEFFGFIVASMPNIEDLTISFWDDSGIQLESDYDDCTASRCDGLEKALLEFTALKLVHRIDVKMLMDEDDVVWLVADHLDETTKPVEEMIRTGDQGVLDRAREVILRNQQNDFAVYTVDQHPELIRDSGFSREWWLEKLGMPYFPRY
jgi:hypothetical protein